MASKDLLTRKNLDDMKPGTVFATGEGKNETGVKIKWVAVRGDTSDWKIYYTTAFEKDNDWIKKWGFKVHSMVVAEKLVPFDQTARDQYRH